MQQLPLSVIYREMIIKKIRSGQYGGLVKSAVLPCVVLKYGNITFPQKHLVCIGKGEFF